MFGILALIVVGAFVGIPILAVCSFRNRAASRPETLPTWRNRTGIVSLGVILCVWLFLVVLTILRIINESWRYILTENMNAGPILLAVAASISCCVGDILASRRFLIDPVKWAQYELVRLSDLSGVKAGVENR
jgi:O-antigen ligase